MSGCAGAERPTAELAAADFAVEQAEASSAPSVAPAAVERAREKLDEAQAAADADDNVRARRLAEQATVDARLAEARTDAEIANQNLEEMKTSIELLQESTAR
ncbi:MAG: DUF4398 domain-containing protein [Geminicoccaceae bacterium]